MNYVDPNYEPPLFGSPADAPAPAGGPVELVDALTRAERKIAEHDWAGLLHSRGEVKFMEPGGAAVKTVEPQRFQYFEPQVLQYTRPDLYHRDLAEFRAGVIDTLQVEIVELRNEIAALKMDRDAKMDLARGLGAVIKNEPTKGDVLARAIRADTPHNAYGR